MSLDSKALYCLQKDIYELDKYTPAELEAKTPAYSILDKHNVYEGVFEEDDSILVVCEREEEIPASINYDGRVSQWFSIAKEHYSQRGMITRDTKKVKNTDNSYYASTERISEIFKNNPFFDWVREHVNKNATILIIDDDTESDIDTYVYSIIAIAYNIKVYYMRDDGDDYDVTIASNKMLNFFSIYKSIVSSSKLPLYLTLEDVSLSRLGSNIKVYNYLAESLQYSRVLPCVVKSISVEPRELTIYRLRDIDYFVTKEAPKEAFKLKSDIVFDISPYCVNAEIPFAKLKLNDDRAQADTMIPRRYKYIDPITGLVGEESPFSEWKKTEVDTTVGKSFENYATSKARVYINGTEYIVNNGPDSYETGLRTSYLLQLCNVLSELIYKSKKKVFLYNIVCFKNKNNETWLAVYDVGPTSGVITTKSITLNYYVKHGNKEPEHVVMPINVVRDYVFRVNLPGYCDTKSKTFSPLSKEESQLIIRKLMYYLCQFSYLNSEVPNIPGLADLIGRDYMNEVDCVDNKLRRQLLSSWNYEISSQMIPKGYYIIPRGESDTFLSCYGNAAKDISKQGEVEKAVHKIIL